MNFKIDTKEKFQEIVLLEPVLSANMTDELIKTLSEVLESPVKNLIVSFESVNEIEMPVAQKIAELQLSFYEAGSSFVICELKPQVEKQLDEAQLLEEMNVTPTLSEAWDIVQMEEIERELLNDF